jgi:hypothetical protein
MDANSSSMRTLSIHKYTFTDFKSKLRHSIEIRKKRVVEARKGLEIVVDSDGERKKSMRKAR